MRAAARRGAFLALLAVLCAMFVALAAWQVERRAWKHALIERVERRVRAAPVDAPAVDAWSRVDAASDGYRHVRLTGSFIVGRDTFVQAATALGAGYWLLVPLRRDDGTIVFVNRGFVAGDDRARVLEAAGRDTTATTVVGLLRTSEPGGAFLRSNDPAADRWSSRDVGAIAAARGLGAERVAPYFVDADADAAAAGDWSGPRTRPVGGLTVVAFVDHHLLYAIVWAALAALCAGAAALVFRSGRLAPTRGTD